jgi:hypothetical protein
LLVWPGHLSLYRENEQLKGLKEFSKHGNEVAFGTIGNASTSEGIFFESVNAAAVLQIPMVLPYGTMDMAYLCPTNTILLKIDISKVLEGFRRSEKRKRDLHYTK